MIRFRNVISESLKNQKTFLYLSYFNFLGAIFNEFDSSQVNLKEKNFFSKTIYNKKTERGAKITPPCVR